MAGPTLDPVPEQHRVDARPDTRELARHLAPPRTPPGDGLLIPAVHELVDEWVQAARDVTPGPLPRLRSDEFLDAEPAVQLAVLLIAAEAWLIADPHMVVRARLAQVGHDIHGGNPEPWRRLAATHLPHDQLQARRDHFPHSA